MTNKLVAFIITPIVVGFTAWLVPFLERNLPGTPDLNDAEIAQLAIAGALAAGALCFRYLSGLDAWQRLETFGSETENVTLEGIGTDVGEDFPATSDVGDAGKP